MGFLTMVLVSVAVFFALRDLVGIFGAETITLAFFVRCFLFNIRLEATSTGECAGRRGKRAWERNPDIT